MIQSNTLKLLILGLAFLPVSFASAEPLLEENFEDAASGVSFLGQSNWKIGLAKDGREIVTDEHPRDGSRHCWKVSGANFYVLNTSFSSAAPEVKATFKLRAEEPDLFMVFLGSDSENTAILQFDASGTVSLYNGTNKRYEPVGNYETGRWLTCVLNIRFTPDGAMADVSVDGAKLHENVPVMGAPRDVRFFELYSQMRAEGSAFLIDDITIEANEN